MKAIQVTCPNCGAKLRATETSSLVTCEYCGTASTIQRRTRILERVMPPAQTAQGARYAVQAHSGGWKVMLVVIVLLPLLGIAAGIWGAVKAVRRTTSVQVSKIEIRTSFGSSSTVRVQTRPAPAEQGPSWQGTDNILVADVDGDGAPELVGRGRQVNAGDVIRVLALDLAKGVIEWQSEPLGTYSDTYRGPLAIAGDLVVFASDKAELQTFAVKDGTRRWRIKLDERVQAFCLGDNATLIAVGADDMLRTLSLADGSVVGEPKPAPGKGRPSWERREPCKLLPSDGETAFERMQKAYKGGRNDRPGLNVTLAIELPDGGTLLNASRKEGTRVTTIAVVDANGTERWRTTAAEEALAAEGPARHVVAGEREACILYDGAEYRLACFALADGRRLWDTAAPSFAEGLTIVGRSLVMTTARQLEVRDLDTGAVRWTRD